MENTRVGSGEKAWVLTQFRCSKTGVIKSNTNQTMGSTQSIAYQDGLFFGAADPRRPGALALGVSETDVSQSQTN